MATSATKIDYKTGNGYSRNEILALAEHFIENATADLEHLIEFGLSQEFIDELGELARKLELTPTEQQDLDNKTQATREKNTLFALARKESIRIQKQLQFYHAYKTSLTKILSSNKKNLNAMKEADIVKHLTDLSDEIGRFAQVYSEYGIKPEKASELMELSIQLTNANIKKTLTYKKCHINATFRSDLKFEIYALCKHISVLGKLYWKEIDSFRYKKYLITKPKKRGR